MSSYSTQERLHDNISMETHNRPICELVEKTKPLLTRAGRATGRKINESQLYLGELSLAAVMDLIVFSDDWGRHPSSCQHLVTEMLPCRQVCWVNTLGTRRPRLDWYTVTRGAQKLRDWIIPSVPESVPAVAPSVVLNPVMWPSFASVLSRSVNHKLLRKAVNGVLPPGGNCVAITTIPLVADLVGQLPVRRWIYYCVDDLSEWPGLDKSTLQQMEGSLVESVDEIVAVSENLVTRIASLGRSASLLSHGVDPAHWTNTKRDSDFPWLESLPRPLVVFWGVLDKRLNDSWLLALSDQLTKGTVLLVGPHNRPPGNLKERANIRFPGPVAYGDLPCIAAAADVLIMPYERSPVTEAMQPLKLKEYLSTGKACSVHRLACYIAMARHV